MLFKVKKPSPTDSREDIKKESKIMKKRFLAIVCMLAMVLSLAACGGTPAADDGKYMVGICQLVTHDALDAATKGFKDALIAELGEENVVFLEENAAGDSALCGTICTDFVSKNVDLILANATPALQAAAAATEDIPILGTSVTEYGVALEIQDFGGTVGGNISGTSDLAPLDKQADMIVEWFPEAKNVGLLYCSAEPNSLYQVNTVKAFLQQKGLTCTLFPFADTNDAAAVAQNAADASDVIYVPTDNTVASNKELIDNICRPAGVPIIAGEEGICGGCGVATLSINYYDLGVTTGKMAAKILTGEADISEMPVAYADIQTPKYNAEICADLNLTAPAGYVEIQ